MSLDPEALYPTDIVLILGRQIPCPAVEDPAHSDGRSTNAERSFVAVIGILGLEELRAYHSSYLSDTRLEGERESGARGAYQGC